MPFFYFNHILKFPSLIFITDSYLLQIKISLLKSSAYLSQIEANSYDSLATSTLIKVENIFLFKTHNAHYFILCTAVQIEFFSSAEDDQFEADKAQVIREITNLNPRADDGVQ